MLLVAGEHLTVWAKASRDIALMLLFAVVGAVAVVRFVFRRPLSAPPSNRLAVSLAGILLFPLLADAGGPAGRRIVSSLFSPRRQTSPYDAAVEHYERVHDRQTVLSPGLYNALMHVRGAVPAGRMFAADPMVIRAVPFLTNEYIVHSGVPFDFVEPYFAKYYRTAVSGAQHQVIPIDPLFREDRSLEPDAVEQAEGFVRDFAIDYVLVTPRFHEYTGKMLARLDGRHGWSVMSIHDADDYAIYRIDRDAGLRAQNGR